MEIEAPTAGVLARLAAGGGVAAIMRVGVGVAVPLVAGGGVAAILGAGGVVVVIVAVVVTVVVRVSGVGARVGSGACMAGTWAWPRRFSETNSKCEIAYKTNNIKINNKKSK